MFQNIELNSTVRNQLSMMFSYHLNLGWDLNFKGEVQ